MHSPQQYSCANECCQAGKIILGIAASAQKTETSSIGKSLYFGASGVFS